MQSAEWYCASVGGLLPHWKVVCKDQASKLEIVKKTLVFNGSAMLEAAKVETVSFRGLLESKRKELEWDSEFMEQEAKRVKTELQKVADLIVALPSEEGSQQTGPAVSDS